MSSKGDKMSGLKRIGAKVLLATMIVVWAGCQQAKVKRVGMVIGIKPEKIAQYKELHADSNHGVRDLLTK